jgi:hypothetical protein
MKTGAVVFTVLAGVAAIGACETSTPLSQSAGPSGARADTLDQTVAIQLIILFRAGTLPADPSFLAALSRDIGTPLAYLRPLSGGAHLLRALVPPESVSDVVRRLQNRPDVLDVQPDVAVRRQ